MICQYTHYQYITCLNITILANDIIYASLYQVHIFQNAHDEIHMHTPHKSFHPIMVKLHAIGKSETRCNVYQEIGIQI